MLTKFLLAVAVLVAATPSFAADFTEKLDITPNIYPPTVVGTQPCLVPVTVGVGWTGFGAAGGTAIIDKGCEDRNYTALLYNIGKPDAAKAYLCMTNPRVAQAFQAVGESCYNMKKTETEQTSQRTATPKEVNAGKQDILAEIIRYQTAQK